MTTASRDQDRGQAWIVAWLACVAAMVFAMVVIGGLTRLTGSGLSMVDWRPITGWLPPLTDAGWQAVFEAYRDSPQYRQVNAGMTLAGFQGIFWLEYLHRLWGRLIGVAFFVPFVVFLARGWISRALMAKLIVLFVLGALQGVVGWLMVQSGLVDRPEVSHIRLAAHFVLALAIYGGLVWLILSPLRSPTRRVAAATDGERGIRRLTELVCLLVFATALYGAFVAGLDAGLAFNTFPLMDGRLVPGGLLSDEPWYGNFVNNIATVQFTHRLLAFITVAAVASLAWRCRQRAAVAPRLRLIAGVATAWCLVQVGLGATTVLLHVPVPVAAAHQAGALILWTLALWAAHEARYGERRRAAEVMKRPIGATNREKEHKAASVAR